MKTLVKEDFNFAANLGVRSFPTLVLQQNGKYYLICKGYMEAYQVLERIQQTLENVANPSDKY